MAVERGLTEIVKILLEYGSRVDSEDFFGMLPVETARNLFPIHSTENFPNEKVLQILELCDKIIREIKASQNETDIMELAYSKDL